MSNLAEALQKHRNGLTDLRVRREFDRKLVLSSK